MAPELSVDQRDLQIVGKALKDEADGKALRRDLMREMKAAVAPLQSETRAAVLAIPSQGGPRDGAPLRQAIAASIRTETRFSGRSTGVGVRARGRGMPRGFRLGARALNRTRPWRHKVFGRDVWVFQTPSRPQWFDNPARRRQPEMKTAVRRSLDEMAQRIASRVRSRT